MNATDLNGPERTALVGLLAYMIDADGDVSRKEAIELLALQDEMDTSGLIDGMGKTRGIFEERSEIVAYAAKNVVKEDARELIHTLLHDLAQADGNRVRKESALLNELSLAWARS